MVDVVVAQYACTKRVTVNAKGVSSIPIRENKMLYFSLVLVLR